MGYLLKEGPHQILWMRKYKTKTQRWKEGTERDGGQKERQIQRDLDRTERDGDRHRVRHRE